MIEFQFLPGPDQEAEHPSIVEVTPDVAGVVAKRATALIAGDAGFRTQLEKIAGEDKADELVTKAIDKAVHRIRKELTGRKLPVSAIANKLIDIVTSVQLELLGITGGVLEGQDKDVAEEEINKAIRKLLGTSDKEELDAAVKEVASIDSKAATFAREKLAEEYLRGIEPKLLHNMLRRELKQWINYKLFQLEVEKAISLSKQLIAQGRMYRFELEKLLNLARELSDSEINREQVAKEIQDLIQQVLKR